MRVWRMPQPPMTQQARYDARAAGRKGDGPQAPLFPPCRAKDGDALKLRDRMVAAGVSIWHPDPIAALRRVDGPLEPWTDRCQNEGRAVPWHSLRLVNASSPGRRRYGLVQHFYLRHSA